MTENVWIVLILTTFRIVCIMASLFFCYLGYRLYVKGVFEKEGKIEGRYGKAKFVLRNVAPGVVFVVLGTVVGGFAVIRPINVHEETDTTASPVPDAIANKIKQGTVLTLEERQTFSDSLEKLQKLQKDSSVYGVIPGLLPKK